VGFGVLREQGHETQALRSKSWDEFLRPDAPRLDFIVNREIQTRIRLFANLPLESLDRLSLQRRLDEIGKGGGPEGETGPWTR